MRSIDKNGNNTVSIVWAPAVTRASVTAHEMQVRVVDGALHDAYRNYTVRSEWIDDTAFPLLYYAPVTTTPSTAIGVDVSTDTVRRAAIQRALATRSRSATGLATTLLLKRSAVIVYEPAYVNSTAQLLGLVYAVFDVGRFVNATLVGLNVSSAQLQWLDIDPMTNESSCSTFSIRVRR